MYVYVRVVCSYIYVSLLYTCSDSEASFSCTDHWVLSARYAKGVYPIYKHGFVHLRTIIILNNAPIIHVV